ncbi:MAG: flippase-like domain-containing protein [Planctomycetes bacterium]|nr:flippase-like domain-containing protein [Planctomycetota bacterium]
MKIFLRILFLLVGVGLIGVLAHRLGFDQIWGQVRRLGWSFPLIFVAYGVTSIIDTLGWWNAFRPGCLEGKVRLRDLYLVRIAGEAVNNVTPMATMGGEPVKALILKRYDVPVSESLAAVVIAKTTLVIAQILFMFTGAVLLVARNGDRGGLFWGLVAATPLAAAFVAVLVLWQRRGLFAPLVALRRRLGLRWKSLEAWDAGLESVDKEIRLFYAHHPRRFLRSGCLHLAGWFLGVGETVLLLTLLGIEFTWTEAFIIESLGQFAKGLGCITPIPGGVGVQESGGVLIFRILSLNPASGLTLILLKRVRELGFTLLGLCLASNLRTRRSRRPEESWELRPSKPDCLPE